MRYKAIKGFQAIQFNEEYIQASCILLEQARRQVRIRSAVLQAFFASKDFNQALSAFARSHHEARIHILIDFPQVLLQRDHPTLHLMRRLSDKISIRHYHDIADDQRDSFLLIDQQGVLVKPADEESQGFYSLVDKVHVHHLTQLFDNDWQLSSPASQLRQLSL